MATYLDVCLPQKPHFCLKPKSTMHPVTRFLSSIIVLLILGSCSQNKESILGGEVFDETHFFEKSADEKNNLLHILDEASRNYRQPKLGELFDRGHAILDEANQMPQPLNITELKRINSIGYEDYVDEKVASGIMTRVDADNLLYEVNEITDMLLAKVSLSSLVSYTEERIEYYKNSNEAIDNIISAYQLLLLNRDIFASFTSGKGSSDGDKKLGTYCEIGGWFCFRTNTFSSGIGQTSIAIAGGIGATSNILILERERILAGAGSVSIGNAFSALGPLYLTIALIGYGTCRSPDCDDCHEARGIISLVSPEDGPCEWGDFLAYGGTNEFEEVQSFIWTFTFPTNSEVVTATTTNRLFPKSLVEPQLESNSEFTLSVDVVCDQRILFPWEGEPKVFNLTEHQERALPTITLPPTDQYYYESGSTICFSLTSSPVWTPVQWQAIDANTPTGQGSNYCTSFTGSSTFGVSCTLSNNCTGEQRTIANSILVL